MKAKLNELKGSDNAVANPPPWKKARKEGTQRKGKEKENKTAVNKENSKKTGKNPLSWCLAS